MNGGSFDITAVLSYKTEDRFVEYFNKALPEWHTKEVREATLREVYNIAHELKRQQDGNYQEGFKSDTKSRHKSRSKDNARRNKRDNIRPESGPDDSRQES